jgi:hypothetical protein
MPSANTVEQKPAGNSTRLLSFGHEELFASFEVDWLGAAIEVSRDSPTTKHNRVRFGRDQFDSHLTAVFFESTSRSSAGGKGIHTSFLSICALGSRGYCGICRWDNTRCPTVDIASLAFSHKLDDPNSKSRCSSAILLKVCGNLRWHPKCGVHRGIWRG